MRKISLVLVVLLVVMFIAPAQAESEVKIELDGYPLSSDMSPVIIKDRTFVPFRAIAEAMNVRVEWNNENRSINAYSGNQSLLLQVGSTTAYINGTPFSLEVAPEIINNRTLIPLRFFSTAFNCDVEWSEATRTVKIKTPQVSLHVLGYYALGDSSTSSWTNLFTSAYPEAAKGHTDIIDEVALGWFSLDEDGQLLTKSRTGWQRPDAWEDVLVAAKKYNLGTEMVIHMTNEGRIITALLSKPNSVDRAIQQIAAESRYYSGVNLDFEGLGLSERGEDLIQVQNNFSNFVKLLAEELHKNGKVLSLSLHAPNSSYKGYDFAALGQYSDNIIIMAYDYGPKPEPNNMVNEAIIMTLQKVPAEKVFLGISTPSETVNSLETKIGLAKRHNLKGIAIWRLGLITNEMWGIMQNSIK